MKDIIPKLQNIQLELAVLLSDLIQEDTDRRNNFKIISFTDALKAKNSNLSPNIKENKFMPKEGTIVKRKDGRYEAKLYIDGKQKSIACKKNYQEVLKELNKTIKLKRSGKLQPKQKTYNFFSWLDFWLESKKDSIKKSSWQQIEICIRLHTKPNMADRPLTEVDSLFLQSGLNKIQSGRMREYTKKTLFEALNKAVELKLLSLNPCQYVKIKKHIQAEGHALTNQEQQIFFAKVKNSPYRNHFIGYLLTGCRPHELFTIKKNDIDFENETITINGTKTDNSKRIIPLFNQLKPIIQEQIKKNTDTEYVFEKTLQSLRKYLQKIKSDIPFAITVKDFRTTFGTQCLEKGVSLKIVSKWLGHTTTKTTEKHYIRILSEFEKQEKNKIDNKNATCFATCFDVSNKKQKEKE